MGEGNRHLEQTREVGRGTPICSSQSKMDKERWEGGIFPHFHRCPGHELHCPSGVWIAWASPLPVMAPVREKGQAVALQAVQGEGGPGTPHLYRV